MNNILLSNLIKIRWIAILGQLTAILTVFLIFKVNILIVPLLFALLISIFVNIFSYTLQKKDNIISDKLAFIFLFYDTFQLGFLLYLTGGIFNPFCILIIAPVIISATYLPAFWTVILSFFSIIQIIFLNFYHISLQLNDIFVIPIIYQQGLIVSLIITIIFISVYAYLFASSSREMHAALSETKLQLSNQKKITEVGSLSAAAVHELSTPLNTIYLILNDFMKNKKLIKNLGILKDTEILKSEADRCKEILLKLSKNPLNLKDSFLKKIKISDIIKINFEKFNSDKELKVYNNQSKSEKEILFKDEIMYALGNLIQNSILYSQKVVSVKLDFDNDYYNIQISDDGQGFPKEILDRLGQPYVSGNEQGMGLGIFISKNLIENIGGKIYIYNSKEKGAVVNIKFKQEYLLR
ncbi:MAG: hypothetical protein CMP16_04135 [Rickettsiales bacterium]|nr:hypothetical protein [Rickettsiales bacterium]